MKKLLLTLTFIFYTLAINASGIFSKYRAVKRDIRTANEIGHLGGGSGIMILGLSVLIILIIFSIYLNIKRIRTKKEVDKILFDFELKNNIIVSSIKNWDVIKKYFDGKDIDWTNERLKYTLDTYNKVKECENLMGKGLNINNWEEVKDIGYKGDISYINKTFDTLKHFEFLVEKYDKEKANKLYNQEFYIGMTKEELIDSKNSKPDKIEIETLKTKTKEIWIYGNKSSGDVFIFENELLARFKDR